MRRPGHHGSVAVVCGGVGSALRTSTLPSVWADSTVSYFHATPNAHWRRHLRRWTRWRLQAAERGYPGTHTTFCRCIDDSGHHPGGQWQCGSDSEDCQKPSHGFYQKDRRVAELLQFPAVRLPQFAHFQHRFHVHTCLRQARSRHLQS